MERGYLPDFLIRFGVRRLCDQRLKSLARSNADPVKALNSYAQSLSAGPLAEATKKANEQHYELPTDFFLTVLGKERKYSCTYE